VNGKWEVISGQTLYNPTFAFAQPYSILILRSLATLAKKFAEYTLQLLPNFIADATALAQSVTNHTQRMAND